MAHSSTQAQRVYDPLLRLLHATIALSIVALIITSQLADWFEHGPYETTLWNLHILSGYALTASLMARLLWGMVGTPSARWGDLWHPATWKDSLKNLRLPAAHRVGHDPIASLAYLFAYGVMALMVVIRSGAGCQRIPDRPVGRLVRQCKLAGRPSERPARSRICPDAGLYQPAHGRIGVPSTARRTRGAKHAHRQAISFDRKRGIT